MANKSRTKKSRNHEHQFHHLKPFTALGQTLDPLAWHAEECVDTSGAEPLRCDKENMPTRCSHSFEETLKLNL